jgi:NAD(P)-dependent dehydrogenase (short-subunit alcohol dehydrogenase family)
VWPRNTDEDHEYKNHNEIQRVTNTQNTMIEFSDIPNELLLQVILFLPKESFHNFVACRRIHYELYETLNETSLDSMRLYYANQRSSLAFHKGTDNEVHQLSFQSEVDLPNRDVLMLDPDGIYDLLNPVTWDKFENVERMNKFANHFTPDNLEGTMSIQDYYFHNVFLKRIKSGNEPQYNLLKTLLPIVFRANMNNKQQFIIGGSGTFYTMFDPESTTRHDIDIFIVENGCSQRESHDLLKSVLLEFEEKWNEEEGGSYVIVKNNSTLTISPGTGAQVGITAAQFVLRRVSNIEELLVCVDLDCTRFFWNYDHLYTNKYGIRSLHLGLNFVEGAQKDNPSYSDRSSKYLSRGVKIIFDDVHPLEHLMDSKTFIDYYQAGAEPQDPNTDSGDGYTMGEEFYDKDSLGRHLVNEIINAGGLDVYFARDSNSNQQDLYELLKARGYVLTRTLKELYETDYSVYFLEGYYESHLRFKYLLYKCYICSQYWKSTAKQRSLESEEKDMCSSCRSRNEAKKLVTRELTGMVAIVTGGRIKIGYQVALNLLYAGATVIVTTRFHADALSKFKSEPTYNTFKKRLRIYGLNLKDGQSVLKFCEWVHENYPRIHILINNAAQTVRRPLPYYKSLILKEKKSLGLPEVMPQKKVNNRHKAIHEKDFLTPDDSFQLVKGEMKLAAFNSLYVTESMYMIDKEDFSIENVDEIFPDGETDEFGEQLDKRKKNSWKYTLQDIHDVELLEVQMINQIVPTILVQKLMPLMQRQRSDTIRSPSYIINVTSHEGTFHTLGKTDSHIHTNISKSALNMLTRSVAPYYAKKGILVNSVDTGWVSSAVATFKAPPLTCADGAARILYPIMSQSLEYGCLFKNYTKARW